MVLADSHEISRVPRYSGTTPTPHATGPSTRLSRSTVRLPRLFNSQQRVVRPPGRRIRRGPTTPNTQRPPPLARIWFSLLRFRSPLLTEYLFLRVLRCFTSPRSLQLPYTFRQRSPDTTPEIQGFPIRKSQDHSSFTNSPGLIAGYNVLHRLLVPRHSPYALSSLTFLLRFLKHFSLLLIFLNCSLSVLIVLNCTILSYTSFTLLYIFFNVLSLFVCLNVYIGTLALI